MLKLESFVMWSLGNPCSLVSCNCYGCETLTTIFWLVGGGRNYQTKQEAVVKTL